MFFCETELQSELPYYSIIIFMPQDLFWRSERSPPPIPLPETYLFTEEACVRQVDGEATGTCAWMCSGVSTILASVHVHRCYVCLWRGRVSQGALALAQTPAPPDICESISWLKGKHPCPLTPTPSLLSMHPFLHQTTPTSQPVS